MVTFEHVYTLRDDQIYGRSHCGVHRVSRDHEIVPPLIVIDATP